MTPAEALTAARAAGVTLWVDGETLRYSGPREALTADLLDQIKAHKPAILAELARPDTAEGRPRSDERLIAWYWRSDRYDPLDGRYGGTYLAPESDDINTVRADLEKFLGVQITELRRSRSVDYIRQHAEQPDLSR